MQPVIVGSVKQSKLIGFNAAKMAEQMMAKAVAEQNRRLIAYAKEQMAKIAERMMGFQDTGNLLDSLCWAVYYKGEILKFGFFRDGVEAIEESWLHALSKSIRQPVNGREMANSFLASYRPHETNGWEVVWAVNAPYWGYWEKGHENVLLGSYVKFSIMAHRYDVIRKQLKPAKVSFYTHVPKYSKTKAV